MSKERGILYSAPMVLAKLAGIKTQTRRMVKHDRGADEIEWVENELFLPDNGKKYTGWVAKVHKLGNLVLPLTCPYGKVGDVLWGRETYTYAERNESQKPQKGESSDYEDGAKFLKYCERQGKNGEDYIVYLADGAAVSLGKWQYPHPIYEHCIGRFGRKMSSIHMPRWASRIVDVITEIRVQRVQDISEADAAAEGIVEIERSLRAHGKLNGYGLAGTPPDDASKTRIAAYAKLWDSINGKGSWDSNPWVWVLVTKAVKP